MFTGRKLNLWILRAFIYRSVVLYEGGLKILGLAYVKLGTSGLLDRESDRS